MNFKMHNVLMVNLKLNQELGWFNATAHTRLHVSPKRHGFTAGFVNYKRECTQLTAASDKVYQLLVHGR